MALQHLSICSCFPRVTNPPMKDPQNTRPFPWTRLKTLVFTANSRKPLWKPLLRTLRKKKGHRWPQRLVRLLTPTLRLGFIRYYALEVTYFKSSLDRKLLELLWNKYWVNTLSSSSLLTVRRQPHNVKMFANCLTFWFMAKLLLYNSPGRVGSGCRCGDLLQPNSQKFVFIDFSNRAWFKLFNTVERTFKALLRSAVDHLPRLPGTPSSPRNESLTWIPIVDVDVVSLAWLNSPNRQQGLAKHWAPCHFGGRWIDQMSERSRCSGDGLCQPLHCLLASEVAVGGPLRVIVLQLPFPPKNTAAPWANCSPSSFHSPWPAWQILLPSCYIFCCFWAIGAPAFVVKSCMTLCAFVCVLNGQNSDYTTGQVFDLSEKLEQSEAQLGRGSFMLGLDTHDRKSEDKLAKATRDRSVFLFACLHEKKNFQ